MPEKRMLTIPAELARKIDENRNELSQSEFIEFLIDSSLKDKPKEKEAMPYVTREELHSFEKDIKSLLKSFLDFFISYGMELGKQSKSPELIELTSKLQELEEDLSGEIEGKKATIKWK